MYVGSLRKCILINSHFLFMLRFSAAIAFVTVFITGYSQTSTPQTLFSIKGEIVTTDEFMYLYKKNHQVKEDFTNEKIEEYIDLFINFKLKVAEARHRGIDTT